MLPGVTRAAAAAALAANLALLAAGCGGSDGADPRAVDGVTETIEELEEALGDRDLARVCERIFSPEARRRAGGEECPRRLARTTSAVDSPSIELVDVDVGRGGVSAEVRAWTGDDPPAIDSMRFVRADGRYRIDSLSSG
jgi:hypothetical protein